MRCGRGLPRGMGALSIPCGILLVLFGGVCAAGADKEKKWAGVHEGGFVTSIAVDPTESGRIYVATARGLFASADGGETWRPLAHGLAGHFVGALAVEPGRSGALYVGTNEGGILRGGWGAKHWTRLDPGLGSTFVSAIAFDPAAPGTVYLGTNRGVYRSSDGGAHFEQRNRGLANVFVNCLAIDPADGSAMYAGTNSGGVFRSSDGGQTWKPASAGLASGVVWSLVVVPAASPATDSTLYAATYEGIFRSSDRGSSWVSLSHTLRSRFVMSLAVDSRSSTIYAGTAAGIFKSVDRGACWEAADTGLTNQFVSVLAMHPESPRVIYAGTNGGVFKTTDGAAKWTAVRLVPPESLPARGGRIASAPARSSQTPTSLPGAKEDPLLAPSAPAPDSDEVPTMAGSLSQAGAEGAPKLVAAEEETGLVSALAVDPDAPRLLYAATPHGVYTSATAGESWSHAEGPLADLSVFALVADATVPGRLYAGTDGAGVFQSNDRGVSWTAWSSGLTNLVVSAIAVASPRVYVATDEGIFANRGPDGGWEAINSGLTDRAISAIAVLPGEPGELFAATHGGKIFHTKDGGSSWSETAQGPWKRTVRSLLLAGSPPVLWAATERGIFRSANGGGTWSSANTGLTTLVVSALQSDPGDPGALYAVTADGVFRFANGGGWTALSRESGSGLFSLAPAGGSLLYAGGDGAVWKSTDGGKSWKSLPLSHAEPKSDSSSGSKSKAEHGPAPSRPLS